jgi:4-aminobutyrate aminotransferase-like enzyme
MVNAFEGSRAADLPPATRDLIARRDAALGPAYRLFYEQPAEFARASGVYLYDPAGTAYLDAYNNVPSVGHSHPHVTEAVARQLATLNTHTRYLTDGVVSYAERLLATHPLMAPAHAMFTCTGSEANDLALRIARHYTGRTGVIVTANAYHGVTAALAELAAATGAYLLDAITRLAADSPVLAGVRGAGLYLGVDVADPATGAPSGELAAAIVNGMRERRVLISATGPRGSVLKIRPPLPFGREHADQLLVVLAEVLDGLGAVLDGPHEVSQAGNGGPRPADTDRSFDPEGSLNSGAASPNDQTAQ